MGSLVGHVAPGFGFFIIGLWHLFNHIKLHALNPKSYSSLTWFPFPNSRIKYLELYSIMVGCSISISMELFVGPRRHQPFDPDGTIPSSHLHNFEHSNISLSIFIYAFISILLHKLSPPAEYELTNLVAAVAFGQELLLFHLHSTDHTGVEGQYHLLLQVVIFVSLVTTLLGINYPKSFLNSFVRSISIMFQGVWLIVIGIMLWTPSLVSKGCFLNLEDGHKVVRCHSEEALQRAKSLVNIQFSWYISGVIIFSITLYLVIIILYYDKIEYQSLSKFVLQDEENCEDENGNDNDDDVEAHKKANNNKIRKPKSFLEIGKPFAPMDLER